MRRIRRLFLAARPLSLMLDKASGWD